MNAMVRVKR